MLTYYNKKMALINAFNFENKIAVQLLIRGLKKNPKLQTATIIGRHENS